MSALVLDIDADLDTYMSNLEHHAFVSDAASLAKALFASKRLFISASSESWLADDFVQDD